jgi:hypothetical protein
MLGSSFFSIPSQEGLNRAWVKTEIAKHSDQNARPEYDKRYRTLSKKFCSKVLKDLNMMPLLLKALEKNISPLCYSGTANDIEWARWITVQNMCTEGVSMRRPHSADSWWSLMMLVSCTPKYRESIWNTNEVVSKRRVPLMLGGTFKIDLCISLRSIETTSRNMPQSLITALNQAPRTATPNYERENNQGHLSCRSKRFQKDIKIKPENDSDYIYTWASFKPSLKGVIDTDSEHFLDFYGLPKPEHGSSTSEAHSFFRYIVSIN